jgi:Carbohydrate binding module (family 6)
MISFSRQLGLRAALVVTVGMWWAISKADEVTTPARMSPVAEFPKDYKGTPFADSKYKDGAQRIPGKVMCAYYDLGGEGIAYHDTEAENKGSGGLNPLDGKYLNEFRAKEGIDISYTKGAADFWEGEAVKPPQDLLYVGWTEPGEWMNYTVDVAADGEYSADILYTSNRGGGLSLDVNGKPLDKLIPIASTNDPNDTTAWRQWHHWNIKKDAATVKLSKGRNLLTLHVAEQGNMNLGILDFKIAKSATVAAELKDRGRASEPIKPDAGKSDANKPAATATPVAASDTRLLGKGAIAGAVVDVAVPAPGSDAPIIGKLRGVRNPAEYQVLILVSPDMEQWWDKTHDVDGVPIGTDGTFTIKGWAVDPHDLTVTNVGVWIVPKSFDYKGDDFQVDGKPVPNNAIQAAVAVKIEHRKETGSTGQ